MPHRGYKKFSDRRSYNPFGVDQFTAHFLSVGNGHMTLLRFPSGRLVIADCNVRVEQQGALLNYISKLVTNGLLENPEVFAFACTHRDSDHIRGLALINEKYPIRQIWDTDIAGEGTDGIEYGEYMALRSRLRAKDSILFGQRVYTMQRGFSWSDAGATVECLNPPPSASRTLDCPTDEKRCHLYCGVLRVTYRGRSMVIPGDVSWQAWRDLIVPHYGKDLRCDVLLAGHHGSKTFFTDTFADEIDASQNPATTYTEHLSLLQPKVVVISCEANEHFPNSHALALYRAVAKSVNGNPQVYSTCDWGHLVVSITSDGMLSVTPSWFVDSATHPRVKVDLRCEVRKADDTWMAIAKESQVRVGSSVRFCAWPAAPQCQMRLEDFRVEFFVSNAGEDDHSRAHDIYRCSQDSSVDSWNIQHRKVTYKGRHLMLCRVTSLKDRSHSACEVFPVVGI